MTECLDFFVGSWQCKHIILGACHDSGYAQPLGEFASDASKRERITLLHGTNIHPSIADLGFTNRLELETVFAPHRVTAGQPSHSPPLVIPGAASNARAGRGSGTVLITSPGGNEMINPAPLSERLGPVLHDDNGKRLDKKLRVDSSSRYVKVLHENKFCAYYYLRGKCNGECGRNHVPAPLNAREFDDLWYVARSVLCYKTKKGKDCDDPLCVRSHEEGCQLGSG